MIRHIPLYPVISRYIISHHIISYQVISYLITSHHSLPYNIISFVSRHALSYFFLSRHVMSRHIKSHHITSHHIIYTCTYTCCSSVAIFTPRCRLFKDHIMVHCSRGTGCSICIYPLLSQTHHVFYSQMSGLGIDIRTPMTSKLLWGFETELCVFVCAWIF